MPENSGSPMIRRLASAGLGFLSSTCGLPVAGSIGCFNPTTTPQNPPPHLLTRTRASPACVSQTPVTSAAPCARAEGAASNMAAIAAMKANLQSMNHFPEKTGFHINKSDLCNVGMIGLFAPSRQANGQRRTEAIGDNRPAAQREQGPGRCPRGRQPPAADADQQQAERS